MTFTRQAANLWAVKAQLRQQLLDQLSHDRPSRSWTAFRCRSAASVGPTAAGGWPGWPPLAVTRAPSRSAKGPGPRLPRRLVQACRRIETVIGQLVERDHARRVWARDAWHLWSRWLRKLLSHTMAVLLCQQAGLGSPRFAWGAHPLAITVHIVDGCGIPGALVGIEAVCVLGE
jgi:hypothetical protein